MAKFRVMGRPQKEIDWKELDRLCFLQCSLQEIATWFSCSERTIERKVKEKWGISFVEYFGKKRIGGLISLRHSQFKLAEKHAAMAIFLGKNYLGQKDEHGMKHSTDGGNPVTLKVVYDNNGKE